MPSTRARMFPLALALVAAATACSHKSAQTNEPGHLLPGHAAADPASPVVPDAAAEDPGPAPAQDTPIQTGAQKVTFDDDTDPEPTTQVQGAPKRPPIPRFKLFGTRESDGPK